MDRTPRLPLLPKPEQHSTLPSQRNQLPLLRERASEGTCCLLLLPTAAAAASVEPCLNCLAASQFLLMGEGQEPWLVTVGPGSAVIAEPISSVHLTQHEPFPVLGTARGGSLWPSSCTLSVAGVGAGGGHFCAIFTFAHFQFALVYFWASFIAQLVKNPATMRETWVRSLGWENPLEKGRATHSTTLVWRIPWTV